MFITVVYSQPMCVVCRHLQNNKKNQKLFKFNLSFAIEHKHTYKYFSLSLSLYPRLNILSWIYYELVGNAINKNEKFSIEKKKVDKNMKKKNW